MDQFVSGRVQDDGVTELGWLLLSIQGHHDWEAEVAESLIGQCEVAQGGTAGQMPDQATRLWSCRLAD